MEVVGVRIVRQENSDVHSQKEVSIINQLLDHIHSYQIDNLVHPLIDKKMPVW